MRCVSSFRSLFFFSYSNLSGSLAIDTQQQMLYFDQLSFLFLFSLMLREISFLFKDFVSLRRFLLLLLLFVFFYCSKFKPHWMCTVGKWILIRKVGEINPLFSAQKSRIVLLFSSLHTITVVLFPIGKIEFPSKQKSKVKNGFESCAIFLSLFLHSNWQTVQKFCLKCVIIHSY